MSAEKHYLLAQLSEDATIVQNEVERMKALLRAADGDEDSEDTEVKEWLFHVHDVAYDAEDILAKFKQITYDANHSKKYGFRPEVLKKLNSRNDSAVEVEQIGSALKAIQVRIKNVLVDQTYQSIYPDLDLGLSMNPLNDSRGDEHLEEETDIVGIEIPKQELIRWIASADEGKKVLSVIGKAGLGKTSIVTKVFDEETVMKDFDFYLYIPAKKSYSSVDILLLIIMDIFGGEIQPEVYQQLLRLTIADWRDLISSTLQENKYIIFVDEIVAKNVWQNIKDAFPDNQKGSRVVIITSSHEVAEDVSLESGSSIIRLKPLSEEDSWILFCNKAFKNHSCPHHLMEISRKIVNLLDGVPLALHMIGGALRKKKDTIEEWETFYNKRLIALEKNENIEAIREIISIAYRGLPLEMTNKPEAIKEIIAIAYRDLPPYLKPCLLYLSIFTQGNSIEKARVIRLWDAEGLMELKEGETADDVGERYINELVNRSLVQTKSKFVDGRLNLSSIHHLVHDFILSKGREQNIATTDLSWPNKVRRLIVNDSIDNNQTGPSFEHLRSLVLLGYNGSLSESCFSELLYSGKKDMLVKVLDLQGAKLNEIPKWILNMFHLEYLNLSHTNISIVPRSIGDLQNLHFLNLKHTPVKKLPVEILKLQKLEHLLVNRREFGIIVGCEVPRNIGTMVSLRKLSDVEANDTKFLEGVGNLTQLTMLGISKLRRKDGMNLCLSLQKLKNLRILNISAMHGNEVVDLQHSASPALPFLRTLTIGGRMEKLPFWIASLHSLAILQLHFCALTETPLGTLEDLPNLSELLLEEAYEGEKLLFKANTFQRLKRLNLKRLKNLRKIAIAEGSMPLLEELYVTDGELMKLPYGIEHLTKLRVISLENTNYRSLASEDYSNVAHIPRVLINRAANGLMYC